MLAVIAGAAGCAPPSPALVAPLPALERPVLALHAPRTPDARVLVPSAALVVRGGVPGVFVLRDAIAPAAPAVHAGAAGALPQARFRMVKAGKAAGDGVEILSGLAGDEILVLGELAQVRDGSPIAMKR
jgi:hypothetical protein